MRKAEIIILGAGPAGLAAAYYAQKNGLDFLLIEANSETGGNCRTIKYKDFYFDTGAHRFHSKDEEVTSEIKKLMGDELQEVVAPSQIFYNGRMIDFPLSPYNLFQKLPPTKFFLATAQLLQRGIQRKKSTGNFEQYAVDTYGRFIAEAFLLSYSEKLWGLPCVQLSKNIAGQRLKGLDFKTFLIEGIFGKLAKTRHLDGSFYYPKKGFGDIMRRMEATLPVQNVFTSHKVTSLAIDKTKIHHVLVNGSEQIEGKHFINTLPLSLTLNMIDETPPEEIRATAATLQYRHLVLVVLLLDKERFTSNASIYFPEKEIPFTRIYEPKNRSMHLAPPDKTCIVVEIPCRMEDEYWKMNDEALSKRVETILTSKSLLKAEDVIESVTFKVPFAYPILETGFEEKAGKLIRYLGKYPNMHLSGRSALFSYSHLHDQMKWGREIIERIR